MVWTFGLFCYYHFITIIVIISTVAQLYFEHSPALANASCVFVTCYVMCSRRINPESEVYNNNVFTVGYFSLDTGEYSIIIDVDMAIKLKLNIKIITTCQLSPLSGCSNNSRNRKKHNFIGKYYNEFIQCFKFMQSGSARWPSILVRVLKSVGHTRKAANRHLKH